MGWLNDEQICALLPSTAAGGAWKVAQDVCAQIGAEPAPSTCTVYVYPWNWSDGEGPRLNAVGTPEAPAWANPLDALFVRPMPLWKRGLDVFGAGARAPCAVSLAAADRPGRQALVARTHLLQTTTHRTGRQVVRDLQIPFDGRQRRGEKVSAARLQRAGRPGLQNQA